MAAGAIAMQVLKEKGILIEVISYSVIISKDDKFSTKEDILERADITNEPV